MFDDLPLTSAQREAIQHAVGELPSETVAHFVNAKRRHSAYLIEEMKEFARNLVVINLLQGEYIRVLGSGGDSYGTLSLAELHQLIELLEQAKENVDVYI